MSKTAEFMASIDGASRAAILENIARHYGIDREAAYNEVTDPDAEHLLDYVTARLRDATAALMKRHGYL